jgi:hypothetical protein
MKGKPKRWATAKIIEGISLGKKGIDIVIWDKWGKTRKGTVAISIGGIRWHPYKSKKGSYLSWNAFARQMES